MALNPQTLAMAFWRRNGRIPRQEQQASIMPSAPTGRLLQFIEPISRSDAPHEYRLFQEHQDPICFHDEIGSLHDRLQRSASFRTWRKIDSYCAVNADREVFIELKELNRERQERFQKTLRSIKPTFEREAVGKSLPATSVEKVSKRDSAIEMSEDDQEKGLDTPNRDFGIEMNGDDQGKESDTQCSSIRSDSSSVL